MFAEAKQMSDRKTFNVFSFTVFWNKLIHLQTLLLLPKWTEVKGQSEDSSGKQVSAGRASCDERSVSVTFGETGRRAAALSAEIAGNIMFLRKQQLLIWKLWSPQTHSAFLRRTHKRDGRVGQKLPSHRWSVKFNTLMKYYPDSASLQILSLYSNIRAGTFLSVYLLWLLNLMFTADFANISSFIKASVH